MQSKKVKIYLAMVFRIRILLFILVLVIFGSCNKDEGVSQREEQMKLDEELISRYLSENNVNADKNEKGIYYEIIKENTSGNLIQLNDIVSVYYRISLLNGKVLGAKVRENTNGPIKFQHKKDALIPEGINYGVQYMRVGEIFKFYIPSSMAFHDFAVDHLMGPNEVIVAEVEVVEVISEEEQKQIENDSIQNYLKNHNVTDYFEIEDGLIKHVLVPGTGSQLPQKGQVLEFHIHREYLDGTVTLTSRNQNPLILSLGQQMTEGLEKGIRTMTKGERAVFYVPSHMGFGSSIQVFPQKFRDDFIEHYLDLQNIYPFAIIKYEIELLNTY